MRIRSCIGQDMQDALARVRREIGEDAIIISSFNRPDGTVELRTAIETAGPAEADFENRLRSRLTAETMPAAFAVEENAPKPAAPRQHWNASRLRTALLGRGFPERLRESLISTAIASDRPGMNQALASALEQHFAFASLPVTPRHPVLLMGPPGAGKTSIWAKLGAARVLQESSAHMLSLDCVRTGAAGQSAELARLLGLTSRLAKTPRQLLALLEECRGDVPARPCFIDSPATNPYDLADLEFLISHLAAVEKETRIEKVIIMEAGTGGEDAADQAAAFTTLGARALIITKLDTVRRPGGVLAAAFELGLSLAGISMSPYLADGLEEINAPALAELILRPHERPQLTALGAEMRQAPQLRA